MQLLLLITLLTTGAVAQQTAPDLEVVLRRAADYVTQYEAELGNLIGSEEYLQNVAWLAASSRGTLQVVKKGQRHISSDFLIIQVGTEWVALRKVNRVDGGKVQQSAAPFEEAFDDSPAGNAKRVADMKEESTRYNIGDVIRDINLPTQALKVLRKSEFSRFSFEKAGTSRVEGVQAWNIRFRELSSPTLVLGKDGQFLLSYGTLWIEPSTGRVLKTEFLVENPYTMPPIKARTLVSYTEGTRTKILVPKLMTERYETEYQTIDCTAYYTNFRPFEVDVKFEISPPQQ